MFLADKISWDQAGTPPYLDQVLLALEDGLDTAVSTFLTYLWQRKEKLKVVHPYFVEAYEAYKRNDV